MHCGKKWWIREFVAPYIFPLNPDYVAARSLRSLRSNNTELKKAFRHFLTANRKKTFQRIFSCNSGCKRKLWAIFLPRVHLWKKQTAGSRLKNVTQGWLATAFDLAAFRLSMIASVKKSVNQSRTVASMRETGWEKQQEAHLRSDSIVWSEFAFIMLVLLVIAFIRLCRNQSFSAVMWSLRFPFFWSCVCHYMRFTTLRTKNETGEHVSRCPTFWLCVSV